MNCHATKRGLFVDGKPVIHSSTQLNFTSGVKNSAVFMSFAHQIHANIHLIGTPAKGGREVGVVTF